MMMVVMAPANGLRQILHVRELAALRGVGEVRRKLVELGRLGRIAVRRGGLCGVLQIRGDLLSDLLVLGWIRLMKLLQRAHELSERRKLAVLRLRRHRRRGRAALTVRGRTVEIRLQKTAGKIVYGT